MADLRLIGRPAEVDALIELIETVAHVADVKRLPSRYDPKDVRLVAHLALEGPVTAALGEPADQARGEADAEEPARRPQRRTAARRTGAAR